MLVFSCNFSNLGAQSSHLSALHLPSYALPITRAPVGVIEIWTVQVWNVGCPECQRCEITGASIWTTRIKFSIQYSAIQYFFCKNKTSSKSQQRAIQKFQVRFLAISHQSLFPGLPNESGRKNPQARFPLWGGGKSLLPTRPESAKQCGERPAGRGRRPRRVAGPGALGGWRREESSPPRPCSGDRSMRTAARGRRRDDAANGTRPRPGSAPKARCAGHASGGASFTLQSVLDRRMFKLQNTSGCRNHVIKKNASKRMEERTEGRKQMFRKDSNRPETVWYMHTELVCP